MPYPPTDRPTDPPRNELATARAYVLSAEQKLVKLIYLIDALSQRPTLQVDAGEWEEFAGFCDAIHSQVAQAENEFVRALGTMLIGDAPQVEPEPSAALERARRAVGGAGEVER